MGESMEALIHHFKIVTEGFRVPAGQAYAAVEAPRGEIGCHLVSDGGTRPYRAHFRDPSFVNLQGTSVMSEGGMISDVIVAIASIDPVMGVSTDEPRRCAPRPIDRRATSSHPRFARTPSLASLGHGRLRSGG